jgi:hypothetical protein
MPRMPAEPTNSCFTLIKNFNSEPLLDFEESHGPWAYLFFIQGYIIFCCSLYSFEKKIMSLITSNGAKVEVKRYKVNFVCCTDYKSEL